MKLQTKKETIPTIPDEIALWDKETVKQVIGWKSNTALYNAIKDYGFPQPIKIGARKSVWRKKRVLEWMASLEEGMGESNAHKGTREGNYVL